MRNMRQSEKQIVENDALEILRQGEHGILSTVDNEGQPYGVPLNYILMDKSIYFHCSLEGHKLDNLKDNNNCCFTVVGSSEVVPQAFTTNYTSVIAFGKASEVDSKEKMEVLQELVKKYCLEFYDKGKEGIERAKDFYTVYKIDITHLTGKKKG